MGVRKMRKDKGSRPATAEGASARMEIRVAFGETDPYGVVFFASYFKYFHRGIENFFLSRGLSPAEIFRNREMDLGLPIVHAACRYSSPARYGDVLSLETVLKSVRDKVLVFAFNVRPKGGERLVAEGEVTVVAINGRWRASSLPRALVARLLDGGPERAPGGGNPPEG